MRALVAAAVAVVAVAGELGAQGVAETIAPDRPGLGDAAHVVGKGVRQIETGLTFEAGSGSETFTFGQVLLRFGLGPFEARVLPGSAVVRDEDLGLVDPAVGIKVPLARGAARLSAVLTSTLPLGADAFTADEATGAASLVGEVGMTESLGLTVNAGYGFPFDDVGEATYTIIVTPGLSVESVPGLGLYAGYAGFFDDIDDTHFVEFGLAYASDADNQYDLNFGVNTENQRLFVGVGIAHRWR